MKRLLLIVLSTLLLVGAQPNTQSPYGYPWRGRTPITITIKDNTNASWSALIQQSAQDWSLSPLVDVIIQQGNATCDLRGKVTICNGAFGLGDLHPAWTTYDSRNGYMVDAATYYNDSYIDGYINPDGIVFPPYTPEQRAHVVCHEMSHALGIIAEGGCSLNGTWQTAPTEEDYARLISIYGE